VTAQALAPAKVNLYLHVGPPGPDGYHPLSTLAVFADIGDRLEVHPAEAFALEVTGPFASALADEPDNLVLRAVRALADAAGRPALPLRLVLDKQLPVAAGLGGGTSDAAAALRLVRDRCFPDVADAELFRLAEQLAADGPMCLRAEPVLAEGYGERLSPAPTFPDLPAVLVNPGAPCPTPAIFRAYDAMGRFGGAEAATLASAYAGVEDLAADLSGRRNDLEAAARAHDPRVGEAIDLLASRPQTLLARLSGSGATSFALCPAAEAADRLAGEMATLRPSWWIRPCTLRGATA
jgi:4-diphosphocytidyl-2-C-methyl-D-erythritol kinase